MDLFPTVFKTEAIVNVTSVVHSCSRIAQYIAQYGLIFMAAFISLPMHVHTKPARILISPWTQNLPGFLTAYGWLY